jgi:hypothetical protein
MFASCKLIELLLCDEPLELGELLELGDDDCCAGDGNSLSSLDKMLFSSGCNLAKG